MGIIPCEHGNHRFTNPGKPFISPDRFIDEYQSRNERLADVMRRLGICEEKGSGVDKVIQVAEVFQLPAPDFRVGERRTSAVLRNHPRLTVFHSPGASRSLDSQLPEQFMLNLEQYAWQAHCHGLFELPIAA